MTCTQFEDILRYMKEKKECNFEDAKQGAVISTTSGKQRIIIRIDTDILNWFCG